MIYSAVVVTYNRVEKLKENIRCLLAQIEPLDRIYIIDNCSTDKTQEFLKEIASDIIRPVFLGENTGGSGGFYQGFKTAYEEGSDWIWAMDDDAFPDKYALEAIKVCIQQFGETACYWSNCNGEKIDTSYRIVKNWMFVGIMVSRQTIEKVGFPRGDFFIYYDDVEYADRITKAGLSIYKVRDSIIEHQDAVTNIAFQFEIFGREIRVLKIPKEQWRLYYLVRNDILRFSYLDPHKYYILLIKSGIRFMKVLFFAPHNLGVFGKAFKDGILGITGKVLCP